MTLVMTCVRVFHGLTDQLSLVARGWTCSSSLATRGSEFGDGSILTNKTVGVNKKWGDSNHQ